MVLHAFTHIFYHVIFFLSLFSSTSFHSSAWTAFLSPEPAFAGSLPLPRFSDLCSILLTLFSQLVTLQLATQTKQANKNNNNNKNKNKSNNKNNPKPVLARNNGIWPALGVRDHPSYRLGWGYCSAKHGLQTCPGLWWGRGAGLMAGMVIRSYSLTLGGFCHV